jgi:hypothetical protein
MSAASLAREAGFIALLAIDAESLTFRLSPLNAVVDRNARSAPDLQEIEFGSLDPSVIEFRKNAITGRPGRGEVFIDAAGALHRAQLIRETDLTWRIVCVIAHPDATEGDARITAEGELRITAEGPTRILS